MRRTFLTLGLIALCGCVGTAEAQPGPPRRVDAADAGVREQRFVYNRIPRTWQASCVAQVGCARPAAIPRCGAGAPVMALDDLWTHHVERQGQRVRVRGSLYTLNRPCTRMRCSTLRECCNRCWVNVDFHGASGRRLLLDLPPTGALQCEGDSSGQCCTTEIPSGEVVAEGTLQPLEDSGGTWRLAGAQVCVER